MLIKEVAEKAGISRDTIRYYDKLGLLEFDENCRQLNNYRDYPEAVFDRLFLIKQAKSLGFSLGEICLVFKQWEDGSLTTAEKTKLFTDKIQSIDQQIKDLKKVKAYLKKKIQMVA